MSTFGEKLRRLREERGETQEDIARLMKISRTSISKYESNDRKPDIETIKILSKHFGVSVDFMVGLDSNSNYPGHDDASPATGSDPSGDTVHTAHGDEIYELINDERFIRLAKKINENSLDINVIENLIDNVISLNKKG